MIRKYKKRPPRSLGDPNLSEYGSNEPTELFCHPVEFPRVTMYYQSQRVADSIQRCLDASRLPLPLKPSKPRPRLKPIPPPEISYMHIRKSRGLRGRMK